MISVVVPTYNEEMNIGPLIKAIATVLHAKDFEIVVVDDSSTDGTAENARALSDTYPVRVIVRTDERGLSSAILRGFQESRGDIIGVMDADFQHPPEVLLRLVTAIEEGADIAVGSRYIKGGFVEDWPWHRRIISWGARLLARPLTPVKDCVSGLFFLRKSLLSGLPLNPIGYKLGLEIIVRLRKRKIIEVPYTFHTRKEGTSKLGGKVMWEYLKQLWSLYVG